jgi:hypothetical protein
MRLNKLTQNVGRLCLIMLLVGLSGCAKGVTLYPMTPTDLHICDAPGHENHVCMTEEYMKEVLEATLELK